MQPITDQQITNWMNEVVLTYTSYAGGVYIVDDNLLARDACEYMYDYDAGGNIPSRYFDIAGKVAKNYEKIRNRQ